MTVNADEHGNISLDPEGAIQQIHAILGTLSIQDRFRAMARISDSMNQQSVRYEDEEFHARRQRILDERRNRLAQINRGNAPDSMDVFRAVVQ